MLRHRQPGFQGLARKDPVHDENHAAAGAAFGFQNVAKLIECPAAKDDVGNDSKISVHERVRCKK